MEEKVSFKNYVKMRKKFLAEHQEEPFYYELGKSHILLSAPHAVSQVRLGKPKYAEPGTVSAALILAKRLNASYIVRTKNNEDDPNFDQQSPYREKIKYMLSVKGVKYLLDIHGLAKHRECDINLGIHLGENIKSNAPLFNKLEQSLKQAGFVVYVDQPFMAQASTISSYFAKEFGVWTVQLEINSKITNESANIGKLNLLLNTLTEVFKTLN